MERFVKPGSIIAIGGFTINRNPMALVYEIVRQIAGKLDRLRRGEPLKEP